jgi:hypothetical protein
MVMTRDPGRAPHLALFIHPPGTELAPSFSHLHDDHVRETCCLSPLWGSGPARKAREEICLELDGLCRTM